MIWLGMYLLVCLGFYSAGARFAKPIDLDDATHPVAICDVIDGPWIQAEFKADDRRAA